MRIDLLHNRIVADCISPRFKECFENILVPMLSDFNPEIEGVLMYEDYLASNLTLEGEWYYPLTVFVADEPRTQWIKWRVGDGFRGGCPYSYYGAEDIEFAIVSCVPDEFKTVTEGRAISYPDGCIRIRVVGVKKDPAFLVGRYSQTFVDEMARQISDELIRNLSLERVDNGTLEIQLVFAGDTYMEHTAGNVTYRRLLLTDKGCQPRDFWIKWTRLDGAQAYTVRDSVCPENIKFELGEDVPQKIREKEYRFLCRTNPDKYQSAMGKRTVTEWRELIKRSLKRGELVKIELPIEEVTPPTEETPPVIHETHTEASPVSTAYVSEEDDLDRRLKAILGDYAAATAEELPELDDSDITMMARAALGVDMPAKSEAADAEPASDAQPTEDGYVFGIDMTDGESDTADAVDTPDAVEEENGGESMPDSDEDYASAPAEEDYEPTPTDGDYAEEDCEAVPVDGYTDADYAPSPADEAEAPAASVDSAEEERRREERIRREIEARVRMELEAEARAKAEAEAERMRAEHERLREENERLRAEALRREEEARRAEDERIKEQERLRAEENARLEAERLQKEEEERARARIAEQARIEEAERQRLAEIAKTAIAEQQHLEEERRIREERERAEREAREEARRQMEAQRLERERLAREEEARRRAQPTYITKHARLIFRRPVDLNVITKIKEIVEATLVQEQKAHIHIYMKAYPIDSYTINLDMKLPDTESELLVTLVKAIGNGRLGITKIIVE